MIDPDNKRRHRRFNVDLMDIRTHSVYSSDIVIRDISITGASVITGMLLESGKEYSIRIMDNNMDFTISGTVIWSDKRDENGPEVDEHLMFAAGLQFSRLEQHNIKDLTRFIEQHLTEKHKLVKVHDMSGCRCNVRYRVDRRETAVLNHSETYRVRKLSLGGGLLESPEPLEPDTRLNMELMMPDGRLIGFVGRVASCSASEANHDVYDIGIEFLKISDADRSVLKDFIRGLYLDEAGF